MKRLVIISILIICTISGCSKKPPTELKFNSGLTSKELYKLNGKQVTINGFLAAVDTNKLSGYLVPSPYSTHVDFEENAYEIIDCIMFTMPEQTSYEVTDLPITLSGIFKVEDYTDSMGYKAHMYISDASVKLYESTEITDITVYSELAKGKFVQLFDAYMSEVYTTTNYLEIGEKPSALDSSMFSDLYTLISSHEEEAYSIPKQLALDGMALVKDINNTIAEGDLETLSTFSERGQTLYNSFYTWLKNISF